MSQATSASRLMLNLAAYFVLLFGSMTTIGIAKPDLLSLMPMAGTSIIEIAGFDLDQVSLSSEVKMERKSIQIDSVTSRQIGLVGVYLAFTLLGTILVTLPITWTYIATRRDLGFQRTFVHALIAFPICAATIVVLVQNNLALAFGLAAMVAAVRFRISLEDTIDGIYVFSTICIGLAAGIGFLGIAAVMAVFFCFTNAVLWKIEYGRNPIDDARAARKNAKLEMSK